MGQSGNGEFRVPNGGPKPLHKGGEGRSVGEGVERTGEILLAAAKCKSSGMFSQARGNWIWNENNTESSSQKVEEKKWDGLQ